VIFVDASRKEYKNGFSFYRCIPARSESFTTHKLEPGTVLWLANDLFNQFPEVHVMAISGMEWELHQGVTLVAQHNFERAVSFFKEWQQEMRTDAEVVLKRV
jgi:hypothetical protein